MRIEPRDLVEEVPSGPTSARTWLRMLAGPLIWSLHFLAVYLPSEAVCTSVEPGAPSLAAPGFMTFVLVATVVAALASLGAALHSWRRSRDGALDAPSRAVAWVGTLLAIGSCLSVVAVGLPVMFLDGC